MWKKEFKSTQILFLKKKQYTANKNIKQKLLDSQGRKEHIV